MIKEIYHRLFKAPKSVDTNCDSNIQVGSSSLISELFFSGRNCGNETKYLFIGKDVVFYTGIGDVKGKAGYCLTHEEERLAIARSGQMIALVNI